ncbi:hypothetical protein E1180_18720 [Roseibium denhamense]|uniref:Uncharacterized protein n=1 Tax=Roseibium denhamense TaxID=76305 RepID=A0ABY1PAU8_9HYPH|nr:hypothetical protein [Roseibium denhamense]MTI07538.1 hypothetical protein [Roseibium denhamense]SMP30295.1 hypothetical protein SAMN06265374_3235 [Roseibium denhamense]
MASVSDSTSSQAAYSAANVRSELATNAVRDQNEQERQVAERLEESEATDQQDRRDQRQIPGLGEAVDITV